MHNTHNRNLVHLPRQTTMLHFTDCNKITKTITLFFKPSFFIITSKSLMFKRSMFEMMMKMPLDFHLSYPGTVQWHRHIILNASAISKRKIIETLSQLFLKYELPCIKWIFST